MKIPMIMQHRIYLGFRFAYKIFALFHKLMVSYITLHICNLYYATDGGVNKLCLQDEVGRWSKNVHFLSTFIP
jgi:hypothetical protein